MMIGPLVRALVPVLTSLGGNVKHKAGLCFSLLFVGLIVLPAMAKAQQTEKVLRLGIICGATCEGRGYAALKDGLARHGWLEGRNLVVHKRGAGGEQGRLPALA